MRRVLLAAALIALLPLGGCIWWGANIPGTIAYNRRIAREAARASQAADSLNSEIISRRDTYYACVSAYAAARTRAVASATEIADGAEAACAEQFASIARGEDEWARAYVAQYQAASPEVISQIQDMADVNRREILSGLREQARARAIRVVVDARGR